ncbi:hypothetical protein ACP70R_037251 [Stipagrostis hirtigluma subsp. patula]
MAAIGGMLAAAVLKVAVGKVAAAAGDRIILQWRFSKDLERMRDTMESIGAVLEDAERRSIEDASVRLWLERLTRASYNISDMFDEFEVNTTKKSALRKFKVLNPCLTLAPEVRMAGKMKKVMEELENISNHQHKFSFASGSSSDMQKVINEPATSSKVIEADILGRDQEKQKVIALLMEASATSEFIILPIHGIGGIGKTTLAQLIFNDTHFKNYEKAWVHVSQAFDLKKIDDSITSQLQVEQSQLTVTQDADAASKKILIVLDDLWEKNDFKLDGLKNSLKIVGNGRKVHVIVTTRDADIARKTQTTEAHKIEPLSSDTCWSIIKQIVGFKDRADKERLEDTGKKIAEKCGGVALAAQALGFMLRFKNYSEWVSVKDSGLWNVSAPGYTPSAYDNVRASLKLSYNSMLPYQKLCFAYCAIFPKGHKMAKDDLIYQWASLGFINPSDEIFTWQHGENCIKQLLELSFFQHAKSPSSDGQNNEDVTFFTMHDLVHDLARSIIGNEVLDASTKCNMGGSNCRYASLADCSKPLNLFVTYPEKIRALRFLRSYKIEQCAVSTAKYLRVLDLGECSLQKLPSWIGQLKLLKYLNAPGIQNRMIPSSISKLSKLIFLNIRGSSLLSALPDSIGELECLMYLDLSGCLGITDLPESFGKLRNLVHLDFSNCSHVRGVSEFLGNFTELQYLNLSYCKNIGMVPSALSSLTQLQYLNLSCSSYSEEMSDGDVLGTLTNLVHLNLSSIENYSLKMLPVALGSFTELKYLNLSGLCMLEELPRSFEKLTNLVHLDLSNCFYVSGVLEALQSLTKLRYLNLSEISTSTYDEDPSPLYGLPKVIRELTELRYLNLSKCLSFIVWELSDIRDDYIGNFFDNISVLSDLEHLDLSNNDSLHTVPYSILRLRKLHTLDLTGCSRLRRLPENIGYMDSLKFLFVSGCPDLDKSTLQIGKSLISLANFVVEDAEGEQSSNLVLLKDENPPVLKISHLENVKSLEEAQSIELREKKSMVKLALDWTGGKKRSVKDMDLLSELVPPNSLEEFELRGCSGVSFPAWLMDSANYLPNLSTVKLAGLPKVSRLPPLGQLPNLKDLYLEAMPNITKIDRDFCGGMNAFARLGKLSISNMERLEEWSTLYPYAKGVALEFMFPNLETLTIQRCRKLRLNPCPPRVKKFWNIIDSDGVLLQWGDSAPHTTSSTSAHEAALWVKSCMVPMHKWMLLHHLPALNDLTIEGCDDLSSSLEINVVGVLCSLQNLNLISLTSLPQWLGDLSSLQNLCLLRCTGIQALPERLGNLNTLQNLSIMDCPSLRGVFVSKGKIFALRESCYLRVLNEV